MKSRSFKAKMLGGTYIVLIILFYCIPDRSSNLLPELLWTWETDLYELCHPVFFVSCLHMGFDHLESLIKSEWERETSVFSTFSLLQLCFSSSSCASQWLKFPLVAPFPWPQLSLGSDVSISSCILVLWMIPYFYHHWFLGDVMREFIMSVMFLHNLRARY